MARHFSRRRRQRFECHHDIESAACQEFMKGVWQLDWDYSAVYRGVPPDPYMKHWENCVLGADDDEGDLQLDHRDNVIALVQLLKHKSDDDISNIKAAICVHYDSVVKSTLNLSDEQAEQALQFATRLWLHASPELTTKGQTSFREVIQDYLPERTNPDTISGYLSDDFCAKHLWRKGGIQIIWTDDIKEHLISHKGHTLTVFRNSSMLRALQQDPQSDPFPDGFVNETLQTLYLLFRPLEPKKARRNIRYMEKNLDSDLELAMAEHANFDLRQYPYWHDRLVDIQRIYDKKTPTGIIQWWFDRRDRVQFATFVIAFTVFVLTVVFGIISSVTSVWQVYLAYRSRG